MTEDFSDPFWDFRRRDTPQSSMTDEERKEAERLARLHVKETYGLVTGTHHLAGETDYLAGYAAACESKRAELTDLKTCPSCGTSAISHSGAEAFRSAIAPVFSELEAERARSQKLIGVLEKIADPRKRDHREPDAYTTLGCIMHMAEEAIAEHEAGDKK